MHSWGLPNPNGITSARFTIWHFLMVTSGYVNNGMYCSHHVAINFASFEILVGKVCKFSTSIGQSYTTLSTGYNLRTRRYLVLSTFNIGRIRVLYGLWILYNRDVFHNFLMILTVSTIIGVGLPPTWISNMGSLLVFIAIIGNWLPPQASLLTPNIIFFHFQNNELSRHSLTEPILRNLFCSFRMRPWVH